MLLECNILLRLYELWGCLLHLPVHSGRMVQGRHLVHSDHLVYGRHLVHSGRMVHSGHLVHGHLVSGHLVHGRMVHSGRMVQLIAVWYIRHYWAELLVWRILIV